jgi:hypothetical protein
MLWCNSDVLDSESLTRSGDSHRVTGHVVGHITCLVLESRDHPCREKHMQSCAWSCGGSCDA